MRGDTWPSSFALGHECEYLMLRLGQPVERVPAAPVSEELAGHVGIDVADAGTVLAQSERVGRRTTRHAVGQSVDALRR
jgi:hypothetical protein